MPNFKAMMIWNAFLHYVTNFLKAIKVLKFLQELHNLEKGSFLCCAFIGLLKVKILNISVLKLAFWEYQIMTTKELVSIVSCIAMKFLKTRL